MTMVGSPVANDAAHSPGSESTRRRKQSLSPLRSWQAVPFQMELGDDDEHEPDNDNHELGISTPTATCTPADERQPVTMRESIWNHIIGKSKALVLGQMLAFWLASTGAVQSKLYLDCDLSAPMFSILCFYFPLSIIFLGLLKRRERDSLRQSLSPLSQVDDWNIGIDDHSQHNATNLSSANNQVAEDDALHEDGDYHLESINRLSTPKSPHQKEYSFFGLISIQTSLRRYAMMAMIDVYANYTTVLAYKFTTITSVAIFDAFAIPSAIIVSRCFFGRRYTKVHLLGVLICSIGITLNVLLDYREDKKVAAESDGEASAQEQLIEADYPHKLAGDFLAIIGGILFGLSNTLQEVTVKDGALVEYLGCFTFFAAIIAFVQALLTESQEVVEFFTEPATETCNDKEGEHLLFFFATGGMISYIGNGAFLQISDAAFFNLSLLTGDAWAVAFSVFAEGIKPPPAFYVALIITLSGVIIYETAPSPVVDSDEYVEEIQLTEHRSPRSKDDQDEQHRNILS